MSDNQQRSRGIPQNYRLDRGGVPSFPGAYIGEVMSTTDPVRMGRLAVYIEAFPGSDKTNPQTWKTVEYVPPFYGSTQPSQPPDGVGTYPGSRNTYGMWFTTPDIGVKVLCFFALGDKSDKGYYLGVLQEETANHMIPAIGAVDNPIVESEAAVTYFTGAPRLPVTEINDQNSVFKYSATFYDLAKPLHTVQAAIMFQQGLIRDPIRGPIGSSAQRESPSQCFGISTPGAPIYQGGFKQNEIRERVNANQIQPGQARVIGREGGHTFVMDDGDIDGQDRLIRIRTAKGHQITMSDDGECFYINHANGQTWLELGKQGTLDVYSTNSINLRTQGDINLHADRNINMYAGQRVNVKSPGDVNLEGLNGLNLVSGNEMQLYAYTKITIKSNGVLALDNAGVGSWRTGQMLLYANTTIDLNGPIPAPTSRPLFFADVKVPDVEFSQSAGWQGLTNRLSTICTRVPTHEPYPAHNKGVDAEVKFSIEPAPPPGSSPIPAGVTITNGGG
jgi:hypothetical protein